VSKNDTQFKRPIQIFGDVSILFFAVYINTHLKGKNMSLKLRKEIIHLGEIERRFKNSVIIFLVLFKIRLIEII
jgi:hypothetical protein